MFIKTQPAIALILLFGCLDTKEQSKEVRYIERREGSEQGDCNDGVDNDEDGEVDCEDVGCEDKPACSSDTGDGSSSDGTEDTSSPSDSNASEEEGNICGGTAPVIEEISCENTGMQFYPDEGADLPTMTIRLQVSDEDADFTAYTMLVRYDEELDNALAESAQSLTVTGTTSNTSCSVSEANIAMTIYIQSGGSPSTGSTYEWYATVFDAAGDQSEPVMIRCTTPDSSGSGTPEGDAITD